MTRYRQLRGIAIHCMPRLRLGIPAGRQMCSNTWIKAIKREKGRCRWCRLPVEDTKKRYWDRDCETMFRLALGHVLRPKAGYQCCDCGHAFGVLEIEHDLSFTVARQMARYYHAPKMFVAAFMPDNLRYRCHACHRIKTNSDILEAHRIEKMIKTRQRELFALPINGGQD